MAKRDETPEQRRERIRRNQAIGRAKNRLHNEEQRRRRDDRKEKWSEYKAFPAEEKIIYTKGKSRSDPKGVLPLVRLLPGSFEGGRR